MKKLEGALARPTLLGMVYSQSKMRKTTLLLGAPKELRPIAFLDADKGAQIRLHILSLSPEQRKTLEIQEEIPEHFGPWIREGIDFYYPDDKDYYADCFNFATQIAPKYKTVVIDTVSRMAQKILEEVATLQYEGTSGQTKRMKLGGGKAHETVHPTMSDYGFAQDRVMTLVQALDEGPAHVMLSAHEKTGEVSDTDNHKRVIAGPRTIGNAQLEVLPGYMDVVLRIEPRMTIVGGKQSPGSVFRTRNHNFYLAGDRSGLFTDGEVVDLKVFWDKILKMIALGETKAVEKAAGGKG